jgi:acyl carrier protein
LESVEQGLALFFKHQGETLQVHQQYLSNDLEYTRTSYELMRQQYGLSGNDSPAPVSESVERGLAMFHDHQAETLRVHDQYLRNQAEVSRSALEVMKQQTALLTGVSPPSASMTIEMPGRPAVESLSGTVTPPDRPKPPSPLPAAAPPLPIAETAPPVLEHPAPSAPTPTAPPPPAAAAAAPASGPSIEALTQSMLEVVSEKTGYPVEMLELDMEMEADLGIDSIKRVEILGTMMDLYPDLPELNPEEMAELKTLAEIVDHIKGHLAAPSATTTQQAAPGSVSTVEATRRG